MRPALLFAALLVLIMACTGVPPTVPPPVEPIPQPPLVTSIQQLVLTAQDLQQLGMASDGTNCLLEDTPTDEYNTQAQYGICNYTIDGLNNTTVVLQLQKYTSREELNGSYQYQSMHYYGAKGLISENDFGDQSRFRVNSEDDYGAQFNPPNVYYYHLYMCKDVYLIHITSAGSKDAKAHIAQMGLRILSKFG